MYVVNKKEKQISLQFMFVSFVSDACMLKFSCNSPLFF